MTKTDEQLATLILAFFMKQKSQYNEMFRFIKKDLKILRYSKATFNKHLKFLVEEGYIEKTPTKGQAVIYSLNLEKGKKLKKYHERAKNIIESKDVNKEEFYSLPENEQVNTALRILVLKAINGLKARVEYKQESWSFEKKLAVKFWNLPILNYSWFWIMEKCVRDDVYREKIFKILENTLEKIG